MSDPLELELQVVVSHYVGAGNQTQVFCQSRVLLTAQMHLQPLYGYFKPFFSTQVFF